MTRKPAPGRPPLRSARLLGQLRERLRYLHYSLRTEQSYVYWTKFFVRFHGLKHPRDLGKPQVEAFLTMLATERKVSVSTHRQALSALLFLYKEVLASELPWLQEIGRPVRKRRIPAVLSALECQRLLAATEGDAGLLARLLYGTGMRLAEGLSLRVKAESQGNRAAPPPQSGSERNFDRHRALRRQHRPEFRSDPDCSRAS